MINLKRSVVFIALLALAFPGYSGDSLLVNSFNSIRILKTENLWLKTGNSSGLSFNRDKELILFDAGSESRSGDFHRVREGNDINNYFFNTSSYKSIGDKFFMSGSFVYNNFEETGARWSGTYDPYSGNPYLLADSLSGTSWNKENYNLSGGISYLLNDRWVLGCNVDYFAAVAAKQKDPRPQIMLTSFAIAPSFILKKETYNLGFNIGYKNRKEEINYYTFRSSFAPTYFMFKGFGFYSKEIDAKFDRFQTSSELFGGVQFNKNFREMQNLTELRFKYSFEGIEDGSSTVIKEDGGDWVTMQIELNEQLKKTNGKNIHLLEGNFSFLNGEGTEYVQNRVKDGDNYKYITIAKNMKFKRQAVSGNISYNYLKMLDKNRIDWDIKATVTGINNSEKYYYIPEIFTSSYLNAGGSVEIQKNFYIGKIHLAPSVSSGYSSNLSNSILLSGLPEITKNQRSEIYTQEFDYYTADLLKLGGKIQLGYSPQNVKSIDQINLSLLVDYWNPVELETNTTFVSAKIGFVF